MNMKEPYKGKSRSLERQQRIRNDLREIAEREAAEEYTKETYERLSGDEPGKETPGIPSVVRIPTEKEYDKGFMKRFFVARYDASEVIEVSEEFGNNGAKELPKGIYKVVSVKWYLYTDKKLPKLNGIKASITGRNVNEYLTMKKVKEMPQLKNTIKDFAEFVR